MKKWFKGQSHPLDCVDFQTSTSLYEVKSCKLLHFSSNGNSRRPYRKKQHQDVISCKLGRFYIDRHNHVQLRITADEEKKIPKYLFVITVGNQKIWRMKSWKEINSLMQEAKETTIVRVQDVFT